MAHITLLQRITKVSKKATDDMEAFVPALKEQWIKDNGQKKLPLSVYIKKSFYTLTHCPQKTDDELVNQSIKYIWNEINMLSYINIAAVILSIILAFANFQAAFIVITMLCGIYCLFQGLRGLLLFINKGFYIICMMCVDCDKNGGRFSNSSYNYDFEEVGNEKNTFSLLSSQKNKFRINKPYVLIFEGTNDTLESKNYYTNFLIK